MRACVSVCEVAGMLAMANTLLGETWTVLVDIHDGSTEDTSRSFSASGKACLFLLLTKLMGLLF